MLRGGDGCYYSINVGERWKCICSADDIMFSLWMYPIHVLWIHPPSALSSSYSCWIIHMRGCADLLIPTATAACHESYLHSDFFLSTLDLKCIAGSLNDLSFPFFLILRDRLHINYSIIELNYYLAGELRRHRDTYQQECQWYCWVGTIIFNVPLFYVVYAIIQES